MKPEKFAQQIGQTIRTQRKVRGLTQQQLAFIAGVSERFIISLELGESKGVRLDKLLHVLTSLGLSLTIEGGFGDNEDTQNYGFGQLSKTDEKRQAEYNEAFEYAVTQLDSHASLFAPEHNTKKGTRNP